jgi:hypothetical protein
MVNSHNTVKAESVSSIPPIYWLSNSDDVQLLYQVTNNELPEYDQLVAIKATALGSIAFGTTYVPIEVAVDKSTTKKKCKADICSTGFSPFLIFSGEASKALSSFLDTSGERLTLKGPWPNYFGFHVTLELENAVDLTQSVYTMYGEYPVVRKAALRAEVVRGHAMFKVKEQPSNVYVSEEFRLAFEGNNLKGAKFIPVHVV